jgi:sugar O-acyltransferase (sialic acid O-acetyltransferase NeuD family)
MKKKEIFIVGGGGHAKVIYGSLMRTGKWRVVGYTDVKDTGLADMEYLGSDGRMSDLVKKIKYAVVGVGQIKSCGSRRRLYLMLKEIGFSLPVIISESAVVLQKVTLGEGTYAGENSYIGSNASIGIMCIVNTGAVVEHDCRISDFAHISISSSLAGTVSVGNGTMIGMGACVLNGVRVGNEVIVSAGTVVRKDVPDKSLVSGNPARVQINRYAE